MIHMLLLLFSLHGAWAQGHGVGNGGDGFEIKGQVYLRDLMEAGLEKTVITPTAEESYFYSQMGMVPIWRPFARAKLATILERLEQVSPGSGQYLLFAIRMHTWSFVNASLLRIDDHCDILSVSDGKFVQIANRMNGTIRIDEQAWEKMSDENRIALIVHEAIYSLVHPQKPEPGKCLYVSMKTREIVGLLFSRDFLVRGPQLYKSLIEPELDWPPGPLWDSRLDANKWTLTIRYKDDPKDYTRWSIEKRQSFSTMLNIGDTLCQFLLVSTSENLTPFWHSRLSLRPFAGEFVKYDAGFGEQFHLRVFRRTGPLYEEMDLPPPDGMESCRRGLFELMIDALTEY